MVDGGMDTRFGDDRATVGVAKQHDLAIDSVEDGENSGSITVQVSERSRIAAVARQVDRDRGNPRLLKERHHPVKAPGTVPGTVNQHNRCRHPPDDASPGPPS